MRPLRPALALLVLLATGSLASAEARVYELVVPSVQCSYTSEKAEKAARSAHPALAPHAPLSDPETCPVATRDAMTSTNIVLEMTSSRHSTPK